MVANPNDFIEDAGVEEEPDFTGLLNAIDAYAESAYGSDTDGGELALQRSLSLDAWAGKNIEPQPEGRSQVVDWTVFETIQWMLPALCRIFAGDEMIVEFEPFGEEDEQAADQESEYLNYLVTQKNNWFLTFLVWAQDALLTKNAYVMAQMVEVKRTEVITYEGQSEEQVSLLLDGDVELIASQEYPDPDFKPQPVADEMGQPVIDPMTGQPVMSEPPIMFDVQIRQTQAKKKLELKNLPPERCLVDEHCTDFTLANCDYFEYWDNVSISELRQMGHDVPDDIGEDAEFDTLEDLSRDEILKTAGKHNPRRTTDPSTRMVKVRWIWCKYDQDQDGIAEMIYVLRVGEEILDLDYATRVPVSSIVPFINTHRHMGNSVTDLVFDIQRIKTAILRQGLDSLFYTNLPQVAHSNKVDLDDLHVRKPGGTIEVDTDLPDVAGHIYEMQSEFVFPASQEGLRHMDTVTEARVGVNRAFQGIDESNLNHYDRIGKLTTMAAQRIEQIARIMGNGVKNLFDICHELVIRSGHQSESIKLRGQWVEFDPKQWRTGRDMRVVAPFAAGNKDALLERLMVLVNLQKEAAGAGLRMVTEDDLYEMALEVAKAADITGTKFFTDPQTIPPPEPQPDPTLIALDIEKQKADTKDVEVQQDAAQAELNADVDIRKAEIASQTDIAVALINQGGNLDATAMREKFAAEPVQMANESIEATGRAVEGLDRALQNSVSSLNEAIARIESVQNATREIVRDEEGNITGVRVNGEVREVRRDEDGNITGL